jgi:tetratricopeptide (TPR) repeat protein
MVWSNTNNKLRLLLAVCAAAVVFVAKQQYDGMDPVLVQPSLQGAIAAVHYLAGDLNGAVKAYRAHFKAQYDAGRRGYDVTQAALLAGAMQEAKDLAEAELAHDPESIHARLTLGEIALEERRFQEALVDADTVLQRETDEADASVLASLAYARTGKYDKAIDALNRPLRHSNIAQSDSLLFKLMETTGDLEELPKADRPYATIAHYYRYLRIHDDANGRVAIRYAKRAIRAGDRVSDAYLAMGVVHWKQGRLDEALEAALKAAEFDPHSAQALDLGYRVYNKKGDLVSAYRMARAAVEAAPDDPFYQDHLNTVLVNRLGNFKEAEPILEQIVQRHPTDTSSLWSLGYVYGMLGKYEQAVVLFDRAIATDPKKAELYEAKGTWLNRLGRNEEAIAALKQAIDVNPMRYQSHTALAAHYVKRFHWKEALHEYERAVQYGERRPESHVNMCIGYHVAGEFARSVECLKGVLREDPRNVTAPQILPQIQHNLDLWNKR